MVNTQDFVSKENNFITVEEIQQCKTLEDKRVIVIADAYFEEYPDKVKTDGTIMKASKKLIVPVSNKGKNRLLRLNKAANSNLINETGSSETSDWIGAKLQLGIAGSGMPYINPTVISLPEKGAKNIKG